MALGLWLGFYWTVYGDRICFIGPRTTGLGVEGRLWASGGGVEAVILAICADGDPAWSLLVTHPWMWKESP